MSFTDSDEAFKYIESFTNLEKKTTYTEREYRLDRVKYLFDKFDNPHNNILLIHIAGSKGKGSTSLYAASILKEAGYKTGLFASPHIISYKERITLAGEYFPEETYVSCINTIKDFLDNNNLPFESMPTTFELLTLLAFLVFKKEKCHWAVIETGIGGRLDSTNIITPECSVITPIELEHTEILGKEIKDIAKEKSGIIKKEVPCVSAFQKEAAQSVIIEKAKELKAPLLFLNNTVLIKINSENEKKTEFTLKFTSGNDNSVSATEAYKFETRMLGNFQADNAALAVLAVKTALLRKNIYPGKRYYIFAKAGIKNSYASGRIQFIKKTKNHPNLIIDSSHTPASAEALASKIKSLKKYKKIVFVFGTADSKNYKDILKQFESLYSRIIITTPGYFKKSNPEEIYNYLKVADKSGKVYIEIKPEDAFAAAFSQAGKRGLVVITGSFYLAGEITKFLKGG